jgi:putative acetyltransferase
VTGRLTIRPAARSDFDAIDCLHSASVRELGAGHYDPDAIEDWSQTLDRVLFETAVATTEYHVGVIEGETVGFAQLDPLAGELKMLYVDPRWAGQGVGRWLLAEIEAIALRRGLARVHVRSSLNAFPFYLHCGWREIERTTHRLRSGREVPCVVMERELVEGLRVE